MNISERIAELRRLKEAIFQSANSHAQSLHEGAPNRQERAREIGREAAKLCDGHQREIAALSAPIVSLTSHNGRLLLATSGGVFEVDGDDLHLIEFQVLPEAPTNEVGHE